MFCLSSTAQAGENLSLYGYYHLQTATFGFLMDETVPCSDGPCKVSDFTNVVFMDIRRQADPDDIFDDLLGIPRALELGYKIILSFEALLAETRISFEEFEHQMGLLSLKLRQKGYLRPDVIHAIFIIDEPWNYFISLEDQEMALEVVNRYFPGYPTIINYSIGELRASFRAIPEALDIVAFDAYYFNEDRTEITPEGMQTFLDDAMLAIRTKAPGKPVIFIAQSFEQKEAGYFMPSADQMDWQMEYSLDQQRNPEIMGHLWFLLPSAIPEEATGIRGAIEFPEVLTRHRQIGIEVLNRANQKMRKK